ncbi:hypothetical protein OOU_Y34scaffold00716g1 [Pyricularia oryzae Y34]|uniref:Uncharacterized protein n=1 Tax=Pyricularia oryzae (strain Y34) TaxID=1143189 RepID=A0AA97NRX4_PYRO3|nr:hypothetical protein OOU_Y34scaffold00716g1 [Pyricularia oryzae Y34]
MCSQYAVLKRVAQKWVPPRRKGSRFKTELTRRIRHFQQRLLNLLTVYAEAMYKKRQNGVR